MSSKTEHLVHRIDDQRLIDVLRRIMGVFSEYDSKAHVAPIPNLNIVVDDELAENEYAGKYLFNSAQISVTLDQNTSFRLVFDRLIASNMVASPNYNQFVCHFGNQAEAWRRHYDKVEAVTEILGSLNLAPIDKLEHDHEGTLRELLIGFGAQHRSMLESLNKQVLEADERRKAFEDESAALAKKRQAEHEDALAELEKQRTELERQSHMAARRAQLREITDATSERVGRSIAPKGAIRARWGVFWTALLLSGVTAALAVSSFAALGAPVAVSSDAVAVSQFDSLDWVLLARAIIASVVSVGALVYAATWLRGFYNTDLEAAREIERFTYDLNRANWVIETILEVQQEKKGEVPAAWVEGVTRGLFDDRSQESTDEATKALSALLGYTASASFGPDGPQFDVNRRGARRLARDVAGGGEG